MSLTLRDPAHRVSPRARSLWHLIAAAEAVAVVGGASTAAVILLDPPLRWAAIAAAILVAGPLAVVVPIWRFRVHRWEATETAVYTQRGWWARERRIAPMSRVQTVDFAQGPLARLFRLATVTVTTASAAGPLQIEGLDVDVALGLVEELTHKADLIEGDAT